MGFVSAEGGAGAASGRAERRRRGVGVDGVCGVGVVCDGRGRDEAVVVVVRGVLGAGASDADNCEMDWKEALSESREASRASARLFILRMVSLASISS